VHPQVPSGLQQAMIPIGKHGWLQGLEHVRPPPLVGGGGELPPLPPEPPLPPLPERPPEPPLPPLPAASTSPGSGGGAGSGQRAQSEKNPSSGELVSNTQVC
jgi:hypothetical protein